MTNPSPEFPERIKDGWTINVYPSPLRHGQFKCIAVHKDRRKAIHSSDRLDCVEALVWEPVWAAAAPKAVTAA